MSDAGKSVTIDGKPYALDALSADAKAHVLSIQTVDQEIRKIEQQLAIYKTARVTYARALKDVLDKSEPH